MNASSRFEPVALLHEPCLCAPTPSMAGSSFGAGTLAGPTGARQPTEFELAQATNQGKVLANVAKKLKA